MLDWRCLRALNKGVVPRRAAGLYRYAVTSADSLFAVVDDESPVRTIPGFSGLDVQSRMRAADLRVPFVITASDDVALDRPAFMAGTVCLLRKPFSNDELLEAIGIALGNRNGGT
ncbi:MAG: hypothetical protein ABWY07_06720 [Burkholderiales bacterium]